MKTRLKSIYRKLIGSRSHAEREASQCVSLATPASSSKGNVLVAYVIDPFLRSKGDPVLYSHTHHAESLLIVQTFLDLGYDVDVIDYRNKRFNPQKSYTYFVSARTFLEFVATRLNRDCIVIAHLDTSHFLFNNHAAYGRALALQERRGITCPSLRIIENNRAIERADYGVVLGNETTLATYQYANTKLYALPVPSALTYPYPSRDYSKCRRHFLWFGSSGFVHKGLDLALEAFCRMPDFHLHICGPIEEDKDFCEAFRQELFHTPNIHTIGWMDISSPQFQDITRRVIALIYPSCAEGQAGSAVVCIHAGLIPVLSKESGLDVRDFGVILKNSGAEEIQNQITYIASLPESELERMTTRAWEYARSTHTQSNYTTVYRNIIVDIVNDINQVRPISGRLQSG